MPGWTIDDQARLAALRDTGLLDTPADPRFDAVVKAAAALCETPVALVSLLDRDRQWFKARIGTDLDETPLEMAICRHALRSGDLLVIPDLTADERTRDNPLVVSGPLVRFYAGVPLVTQDQMVGTLCVLDIAPRPAGLSADQADGLRELADRALALIEGVPQPG